jgi:hypothetical protein
MSSISRQYYKDVMELVTSEDFKKLPEEAQKKIKQVAKETHTKLRKHEDDVKPADPYEERKARGVLKNLLTDTYSGMASVGKNVVSAGAWAADIAGAKETAKTLDETALSLGQSAERATLPADPEGWADFGLQSVAQNAPMLATAVIGGKAMAGSKLLGGILGAGRAAAGIPALPTAAAGLSPSAASFLSTLGMYGVPGARQANVEADYEFTGKLREGKPFAEVMMAVPYAWVENTMGIGASKFMGKAAATGTIPSMLQKNAGKISKALSKPLFELSNKEGVRGAVGAFARWVADNVVGEMGEEVVQGIMEESMPFFTDLPIEQAIPKALERINTPEVVERLAIQGKGGAIVGTVLGGGRTIGQSAISAREAKLAEQADAAAKVVADKAFSIMHGSKDYSSMITALKKLHAETEDQSHKDKVVALISMAQKRFSQQAQAELVMPPRQAAPPGDSVPELVTEAVGQGIAEQRQKLGTLAERMDTAMAQKYSPQPTAEAEATREPETLPEGKTVKDEKLRLWGLNARMQSGIRKLQNINPNAAKAPTMEDAREVDYNRASAIFEYALNPADEQSGREAIAAFREYPPELQEMIRKDYEQAQPEAGKRLSVIPGTWKAKKDAAKQAKLEAKQAKTAAKKARLADQKRKAEEIAKRQMPAPKVDVTVEKPRPAKLSLPIVDKTGRVADYPMSGIRPAGEGARLEKKLTAEAKAAPAKTEAPTREKDEELLQMVDGMIEERRQRGQPIPEKWLEKKAAAQARLSGTVVDDGEVVGVQVFGHPQATNIGGGRYDNLVPITTKSAAGLERRMYDTQKFIDELQSKIATARAIVEKKISAPKPGKAATHLKKLTSLDKAKQYLRSQEFVDDQTILELLKTETMPELDRMLKALTEKQSQQTGRKSTSSKPLYSEVFPGARFVAKYGQKVASAAWKFFRQGFDTFIKWSSKMVRQFGAKIQKSLKAMWNELNRSVLSSRQGSVGSYPAWKLQAMSIAKESGYTAKEANMAVAFSDFMVEMFKRHPDIFPQEGKVITSGKQKGELLKALVNNADFGKSLDVNKICRRIRQFWTTVHQVEKNLERPMNDVELLALGQIMRKNGDIPGCIFCYVEAARRKVQTMAHAFATMSKKDALAKDPQQKKGITKAVVSRDDLLKELGWDVNDLGRFMVDRTAMADARGEDSARGRLADIIAGYLNGANAAALTPNGTYLGEILNMSDAEVSKMNNRAGMRALSSTDLDPSQLVDVFQAAVDSTIKGLAWHGYSKDAYTAMILAPAGMKVNNSIAFNGRKDFTEDVVNGMPHEVADMLQKKYANAGTMLVAKNIEQLVWALDNDWVWMIIPHHAAMWRGKAHKSYGIYGMDDFAKGQHEKWIDRKKAPVWQEGAKVGKVMRPANVHGEKLWFQYWFKKNGNNEQKAIEAYLKYCADNNMHPKWSHGNYISGEDGKPRKMPNFANWQNSGKPHAGYVKLIKDYARTDSVQTPIDYKKIDTAKAEEYANQYKETNGWAHLEKSNKKTVAEATKLIKSGKDLGLAEREMDLIKNPIRPTGVQDLASLGFKPSTAEINSDTLARAKVVGVMKKAFGKESAATKKPAAKGKPLYSAEYFVGKYGYKFAKAAWNLFKRGAAKFADWARGMIAKFGKSVSKQLRPMYADLQERMRLYNPLANKRGMIRMGAFGKPGMQPMRSVSSTDATINRAPYLADEYGGAVYTGGDIRNPDQYLSFTPLGIDAGVERRQNRRFRDQQKKAYAELYAKQAVEDTNPERQKAMQQFITDHLKSIKPTTAQAKVEDIPKSKWSAEWNRMTKGQRKERMKNPRTGAAFNVASYAMEKLLDGLTSAGAWAKAMVKKFGNAVKPLLKDLWNGIQSFRKSGKLYSVEGLVGEIAQKAIGAAKRKIGGVPKSFGVQSKDLKWERDGKNRLRLIHNGKSVAILEQDNKGRWSWKGTNRAFLNLTRAKSTAKQEVFKAIKEGERQTARYKKAEMKAKEQAEARAKKNQDYFDRPLKDKVDSEEVQLTAAEKWQNFLNKANDIVFDRWGVEKRLIAGAVTRKGLERIAESENFYQRHETLANRIAARTEDFKESEFKPLEDYLIKNNITYKAFNRFLRVMHAEERNDHVFKINPEFRQRAIAEPDNPMYAGSGITTKAAREEIKKMEENGSFDKFFTAGEMYWKLNNKLLDIQVKYGLLPADVRNSLKDKYDFYAPLKSIDEDGIHLDWRALGRRSESSDQLAHTMKAIDATFSFGENARLRRAFAKFAINNPNPALYEIRRAVKKPYFDEKSGEVKYRLDMEGNRKDILYVKNGGNDLVFIIKDPDLLASLTNKNTATLGLTEKGLLFVNRWLGAVNTAYAPEFMIANLIRDIQTAGISLSAEQSTGMAWNVMKGIPHALRTVAQSKLGKTNADTALYKEFVLQGGKIGYSDVYGLQQTAYDLEKRIAEAQKGGAWFQSKEMLKEFGKLISACNDVIESGTRLSTYIEARRAGMSKQAAASLAANVTINFQKKGVIGQSVNALWLFGGASLGGTARVASVVSVASKTPTGRKMLAGAIALGFIMDVMARMLSDIDPDDERSYYDKLNTATKDMNYVFPIPTAGDRQITIPMPHGFSALPAMGRNLSAMMFGDQTMLQSLGNVANTLVSSFSPTGYDERGLAHTVIPTAGGIVVDLLTNSKYTGSRIKPEQQQFGAEVPRSQLVNKSTNKFLVALTQGLNRLAGGDERTPSKIAGTDLSAADVQYVIEAFTGGVGKTLSRGVDLLWRIGAGERIPPGNIPFVRRIYGEAGDYSVFDEFYSRRNQVKVFEDARRDEDAAWIAKNRWLEVAVERSKSAEKKIKAIRDMTDIGDQERRDMIIKEQKNFNRDFDKIKAKYSVGGEPVPVKPEKEIGKKTGRPKRPTRPTRKKSGR